MSIMKSLPILMFCLLLQAGCSSGGASADITDEQFIEAVTALRQAGRAAGDDQASFENARAEILQSQGVTRDQLEQYVRAHASDLDHLARVWERISERTTAVAPQ